MRLKLPKSKFGVREVEILGQKICIWDLKPSDAHVQSINKFVEPGVGEYLMRFLGLIN